MCQKVADVCLVGAAAVCYLYLLIILHRLCAEEKEEIGMGGEKGREEEGVLLPLPLLLLSGLHEGGREGGKGCAAAAAAFALRAP